jgi:hypothetical protein
LAGGGALGFLVWFLEVGLVQVTSSLSLSLSLVGALGVKRLEWCARASRDGAYISLLSSSLRKAHNNEPNLKINHVIRRVYSPLILDSSRTHYSNNT